MATMGSFLLRLQRRMGWDDDDDDDEAAEAEDSGDVATPKLMEDDILCVTCTGMEKQEAPTASKSNLQAFRNTMVSM